MNTCLAAIDVGTASARAGIFTPGGALLSRAEAPIALLRDGADRGEYASERIWRAVCTALQAARDRAGVAPADVAGLAFDATCSLVVRDRDGQPLPVSPGVEPARDTIAWLDHRAHSEARRCTETGHEVLGYLGGVMSPEMQVPKLMWLKHHLPDTWERAGYLFDLADFLAWRATGSTGRSQSTLVCKWTFLGHQSPGWRQDFLEAVGLGDLLVRGRLPDRASPVGAALGCLTPAAAAELGLTTRCRVGAGLVDAHAGALGVLGGFAGDPPAMERHLGLVAGTSNSVITLSRQALPGTGIWGPFYGAVLPDMWLVEAGQSATGALLDHVVRWHGAGGEPTPERHGMIGARIANLVAEQGPDFAGRLHVLPDFHGNRSPIGDPEALGVVSGLSLDASFDSLCRLYWRTAVGIALGVRHILQTLNARGHAIDTLHMAGGHRRNPMLIALYADATGCTVVEPETEDATLLGTAMVAATAAGLHPSLGAAAAAMRTHGRAHAPDPAARPRYDRDYAIFLELQRQRRTIEEMLALAAG